MKDLAVVILARDEARHIGRAIGSVAPIASQVFVVDSGSTDGTAAIARAHGAVVLSHPWVNYARQFQWALDTAPITAGWVMRLDADEVVEPALAGEIAARLPALGPEVAAVALKRRHVFLGRWIRHGGRYPLVLTRIWRRGKARIEDRWMDEHMVAEDGATVTFEHPFRDENLNDLGWFVAKHNAYATREAVDVLVARHGLFAPATRLAAQGSGRQAALRRRLKERVHNRLPFPLAALGYFLFRYVVQAGFLDGREGLVYHALQGGWYRFLVGARVMELDRALAPLATREEKIAELARLTGLKLLEDEPPARTDAVA